MDGVRELPIHHMHERHLGLTQAAADALMEAACVCLDRHQIPPSLFEIHEDAQDTVPSQVNWTPANARQRAAWNNRNDATEQGACLCAIAAVELTRNLLAVSRAETLTGADYYLSPDERLPIEPDDLENCIRLEVSGADRVQEGSLRSRLRRKHMQLIAGRSNLPGIVAVVGFEAEIILILGVP